MHDRSIFESRILFAALTAGLLLAAPSPLDAGGRWHRSADGRVEVAPIPVDKSLRNAPWPDDWEKAFWDRANHVIQHASREGRYGNTFFENEKRAYGWAMLSILAGHEEPAVAFLQSEDAMAQKWNKHTLGIDYYPCFTLKHQMRKYFFFGELLDGEYRARMKKAAAIFTEKDPLRRPHYAYDGKGVWGPDGKNSWVDVRSTDNLKLMRETSVYLLAEEVGSEKVRQVYKERIKQFVVTMYYQGMGEWDSENYLGHSMAPVLNLYDFAKDKEVKALAKAALDFMATSAAVKYWRGAYNGPTRRDYNHPYPFGGSAPALSWLWFGDSPRKPEEFESDEIHVITSAYRPPKAVVHLARKDFPRPAEIIAGKPQWAAWEHPDAEKPEFRETQYFGRHFQFGTLARGTQDPDVNGFKILVESRQRGADTILAAPVKDPLKIGSPQYQEGLLAPNCVVGQSGNLAIYETQAGDYPFLFLVPVDAEIRKQGNATFILGEKCTLAVWPILMGHPRLDRELTDRVQHREKKGEKEPRWPGSKILRADPRGRGVYGFAVEIDEGKPEAFIDKASKLMPGIDAAPLRGAADMTGTSGRRVQVQWDNGTKNVKITRDGQVRDWGSPKENVIWRSLDCQLIEQSWQGDGTLRVSAGGAKFTCTVTRDGKVSFSEE